MPEAQQPFYFRFTMILLMLGLLSAIIVLGQDLVVPLSLATLIAILLIPVCQFLERRKVPRVLTIVIALLMTVLFVGGIFYFLSSQIANFLDDTDQIKKGIDAHLGHLQDWIREKFNISNKQQESLVQQMETSLKGSGSGAIGGTVSSLKDMLVLITLLPIYIFLLLYYRGLIKQFLIDVFTNVPKKRVAEVIQESRVVIQAYMFGLIIEMVIVAAINSVGFLIIGIKYAVFLAVFAAVLNILPYVGMLIASIFCVLITLTTSTSAGDALWVLVVLLVVQFIDNNIIMPNIVGSKVKLNALMTIIGVVIGGLLCGIAGMFLSIPAIAILKIIFDRVEGLEPWGRLLGDEGNPSTRQKLSMKK
ncbi:MAG TPA: AI-2E family transporter [Pseudobacter sp.]|nr:AI-2E family transporter [Pseudobacter sp.]